MTTFASLFDTFTNRAFRYEALPVYTVDGEAEAFEAFLNGTDIPQEEHDEWLQYIRKCKEENKQMCRVRLLPDPPTPYFEFEVSNGYVRSIDAGEEILELKPADLPASLVGIPDFWLFDDNAVAVMKYDDDGHFLGADVHEEHDEVARFQAIAEQLIPLSSPLSLKK